MNGTLAVVGILAGAISALAQIGAQGLSGVGGGGFGGQQGGIFTIPRVEAHTIGIPGVSRPMMMAGPIAGGGLGMGGGGGLGGQNGMRPNPNWIGAAAMFMPQLLTGQQQQLNGANGGANPGAANGGAALQTRTFGVMTPAPAQSGPKPVAQPAPAVAAARPVMVTLPPPDPSRADERLFRHQRDQAAQGSPSAQLALGRRYLRGEGVEANPKVARVWLETAARNGSEEARTELAGMNE